MERKRVKLTVYVDLDPVPGTFHTVESAKEQVQRILNDAIIWYAPDVAEAEEV